jgi:phosphopentomutase
MYTSADPVLQIAAHERVIPVDRLYELCQVAFDIAVPFGVNRVIARPFEGSYPAYRRTERRRDFTLAPPRPTVLDLLKQAGAEVVTVGKVNQLFCDRGITMVRPAKGNERTFAEVVNALEVLDHGLVFANLIDFDMLYGHRRDTRGYAQALEEFDRKLPSLLSALGEEDMLIITADHGNDPTFRGSDHTREYVPLLVYGRKLRGGVDLGVRSSFADIAATVADFFSVPWEGPGVSFLAHVRDREMA